MLFSMWIFELMLYSLKTPYQNVNILLNGKKKTTLPKGTTTTKKKKKKASVIRSEMREVDGKKAIFENDVEEEK